MVKNRLMSLLAVALVLGMSASTLMAQPGGQGGGRGGRGGFGGGGFGGGMGGILSLISNEAVTKDLGVNEEVVGKLKKLSEEIRAEQAKARGTREEFAAIQNLPEEERNKKRAEMFAKSAEAAKKIQETYVPKLKEILSAEQVQRLHQIQWQSNPIGALADPEVIKAIDLKKEQTEKIAAVNKEAGEKTRELFSAGAGGGGAGNREKMQEINKKRDADIAAVLTAEQNEKLKTLKGKEFDVSKLRGGFGGPGGRGGRGGAGARPATE